MNTDVHIQSTDLTGALRTYIKRRLHFALGRFVGRVGRVTVRVEDVPGPGATADASCSIRIALLPGGQMIRREAVHSNLYIAIDLATEHIGRVFERELDRIRSVEVVRNLLAKTRHLPKKTIELKRTAAKSQNRNKEAQWKRQQSQYL